MSDGVAVAVMVVTDPRVRPAADLLAEYVRRSTGGTLPCVDDARRPGPVPEGLTGPTDGGRIVLAVDDGLAADAFILRSTHGNLTIAGGTALAVEFAVLEFLERFLGVRWLVPGAHGVDVPTFRDLSVPLEVVRGRPAFRSRIMMGMMSPTGLGGASGHEWGRHNRLHGAVEFGHALWQILPPARHAESHPQWYPPRANLEQRYGWQPRFSDPSTVAAAVDAVVAHCESHPDTTSISLAVNDYSGFHPHDVSAGPPNSAGFANASDAYYGWVNRVTEGVLDQVPGITIGVLAYHDVVDPPMFPLHPAVVPFLTGDRIAWHDPVVGDRGRRLTAAWARCASELGWWEYLHGASYLVPKVQFSQLATNLRFAADHNVVHYFAESWPDWGGGPQAWLTARLLWQPSHDPYVLLDEWCSRVAGDDAGSRLSGHFRDWEGFWSDVVLVSPWFTDWRSAARRSDYLRFDDPRYLDGVDPARIRNGRDTMAAVTGATHTSQQAARIRQLERGWRHYEDAIQYRRDAVEVPSPRVPESDADATALLDTMAQRLREGVRLAEQWRGLAPADAARRAAHLPTPLDRIGLNPTGGPGSLSALLRWFGQADRPGSRCRELLDRFAADPLPDLRDWSMIVQRVVDGAPNLFANAAFGSELDQWQITAPHIGQIRHRDDLGLAGRGAVRIDGADSGEVTQTVALPPGRYGVLAHYWCPADSQRGTLRLLAEIGVGDSDGSQVLRSPWARITAGAGSWDTLVWAFELPGQPGASSIDTRIGVELTTVIEGPSFPSMGANDWLVLDSLHLHRLDTSSTEQPAALNRRRPPTIQEN